MRKKPTRKALIFYLTVILLTTILWYFGLFNNNTVLITFVFAVPTLLIYLFSKDPFNFEQTRFNKKDLIKTISKVVLSYLPVLGFLVLAEISRGVPINNVLSPGMFIFALLLTTIFLIIKFVAKILYKTVFNNFS